MQVTIFGTGYVGLVTGTCLAEVGNDVVCVDIDASKVDRLNRGEVPIFEPGLDDLVAANRAAGRLRFTTDAAMAIAHGDVIFIAVGTPPDEDGSADLSHVLSVARTIGKHLDHYAVVVNKSTVPVGTADKVKAAIAGEFGQRGATLAYDVVSNPEFLKEGDAVKDCMRPDRIVIGSESATAMAVPATLIARVSSSGFHQSAALPKSGGNDSRASVRIAGMPFASVARSSRLTYHAEARTAASTTPAWASVAARARRYSESVAPWSRPAGTARSVIVLMPPHMVAKSRLRILPISRITS